YLSRPVLGFSKPKHPILGTELSGEVVEVGSQVTKFQIGDQVLAYVGAGLGCHCEYRAVRETSAIVRRPECLTQDEAASLSFGGATALFFLRDKGNIKHG